MMKENENNILAVLAKQIEETAGPMAKELIIIYLDDEADSFDVIEIICQKLNIQSYCTTNPQEAFKTINEKRRQILLIVSDLEMPEMNGILFCEEVRKTKFDRPIVILSGYVSKNIALKAIESKVSLFLDKPLAIEILCEYFQRELLPIIASMKEERDLLLGFIEESKDNLELAESLAMEIEQDAHNTEAINRLFGIIHTIKGSSGFFSPKTIGELAHCFEEKLKLVQKHELSFDSLFASKTLKIIDWMKRLIFEMGEGSNPGHDAKTIFNDIFNASNTKEVHKVTDDNHPQALKVKAKDIKVEVNILDDFIRMSGEMTVIRNMINKSLRNVANTLKGNRDVDNLVELLEELHKINAHIQVKVTDLRKISFKSITRPMARAIRETAKLLKKEVELVISGEELRLDTSLVDVLNNSLIHLVRNSVDHGIESQETRLINKKGKKGLIQLRAYQKNESVYIEIEDDGAGINIQAIKSKLLKNGQLSEIEINSMAEEELYLQIFSAGFSTAEKVTDISGRGVGMSMVKSCVEEIGGQIKISSRPGVGSTFMLELPIPKSVLITNCVFFVLAGKIFGIPQDSVFRILGSSTPVDELAGAKAMRCGDDIFEVFSLAETIYADKERGKFIGPYIIISAQNCYLSFQVEEVLEIEDTVVKPIPIALNRNGLFKGSTFLSDGTVGLIFSPDGIIAHLGIKAKKKAPAKLINGLIEKQHSQYVSLFCFSLHNTSGIYAVHQSHIYRIEEILSSQMIMNGQSIVTPYRNSILHIYPLDCLFNKNKMVSQFKETEDGRNQLFVISHKNHFFGFPFLEIFDVCEINIQEMTPDISSRFGVIGQISIKNKPITIIDPIKFIERIINVNSSEIKFPPKVA